MSLYIAALFLVLFLSLFMILLTGGRMEVRGAVPMLVLLVGMCLWTLSQIFHIFVTDPQTKYFWYQAKFAGIVVIPASFAMLAAEITGQTDRIRPWHRQAAVLVALFTWVAVITDPWLHLFRTEMTYVPAERFVLIQSVDGPAFWLFTGYTYLLIGVSVALLFRHMERTEGREKTQTVLMLLGSIFPWIWNVLYLLLFQPAVPLDLTPVLMLVTETVFLITLFYYSMFNIVPFTKRAVFDNVEDLVVVVDRSGVVRDVNPAAQAVYHSAESLTGRPLTDFMGRLCPVEEPEGFQGFRGGRTRDYRLNRSEIQSRRGRSIGELLVFNDVTALMDARRTLEMATGELDRQNSKKVLFMKQFNRSIRLPMNQILGFADVLSQQALTEEQQEALEHLAVSGGHLIELINDITDYSRIETGALKLQEEPVRLFDLIRHVCRLYEYPAEQKGLDFHYSMDGDLPAVMLGDELRLTQVLGNLVGNAVKFTDVGGISIRAEVYGPGRVAFTVQDTGIGIQEKDLGQVFVPYQQGADRTVSRVGGTGLGLAIVKDLVERMDGTITVRSRPGTGTAFTVVLPCRALSVEAPVYEAGQLADVRTRSLRIALVSRDETLKELIPRYLAAWPQTVCIALSEMDELRNTAWPWDAVLLELDAVGDSGWQMPESYDPDGPARPPVIGLTADMDVAEREQQGRGRLDDCLLIPIGCSALLKALRRQVMVQ